jgi:ABC-2 type transport system ATP-binding protein
MTTALSLRGLGKDYGTRKAVDTLDLDVVRGECLGLLGPNGAGKTTTISMACGVITPTRGSVTIGGIELRREPHAAKAKLGLVPQELAIYEELSATQNLRYFGALYGLAGTKLAARVEWALEVVGLRDRATEPAKKFSGGMKRRLNLAAGLVHEPELLILDEPTVGVDPQSRNHIFETVKSLRAKGMTVLYTSHYMEEVEALCDRVAIMDGGVIAATGSVVELIAKHAGSGLTLSVAGTRGAIEGAIAVAAQHATVERVPGAQASEGTATLRVVPTGSLAPAIAALEGAGLTISRIESREANLETAFLKLTGKSLRDEGS